MVGSLLFLGGQRHLDQRCTRATYRAADGVAQFIRAICMYTLGAEGAGKGDVVRSEQVCGDVAAVEAFLLPVLDGCIGGIVKDHDDGIKLLLYCCGKLTHVEQKASISAQRDDRTLRCSSSCAKPYGEAAADPAPFGWINLGARFVDG